MWSNLGKKNAGEGFSKISSLLVNGRDKPMGGKTDGNWWDKLGKPQYGGEIVIRANRNIVNFDPYFSEQRANIYSAWMEKLHADDWTLDPAIFDYKTCWHPSQYLKGCLAESWEFTDPRTHVVHLRKGIHWQDIPPADGPGVHC